MISSQKWDHVKTNYGYILYPKPNTNLELYRRNTGMIYILLLKDQISVRPVKRLHENKQKWNEEEMGACKTGQRLNQKTMSA